MISSSSLTVGEIDEDDGFGLSDDKDWMEYWRELFPTVTVDDINKFSSEFKGLSNFRVIEFVLLN